MSIYYVRTCGDDTNAGLTPQTAFKTLLKAMQAMRDTPGSHACYVGPGTYDRGFSANNDNVFFNETYAGKRLEFIGDTTGAVTGDAPGFVIVNGWFDFECWTSDVAIEFYSDYITCIVRNIKLSAVTSAYFNRSIYQNPSYPAIVGDPANPPPVNKDTLALRVYCYNCVGRFYSAGGRNAPAVMRCINCVGTFYGTKGARYSLDLGCECWNSIGYFYGEDDTNRVGIYHSCIQGGNGYWVKDSGTIEADPRFVDYVDYYLKADSPCIDAGCNVDGRPTDIMGVRAPQGSAHDMGIHEYVSDLFYSELNITKPRYGGYNVLDFVEGTIPVLAPVDGHFPKIIINLQIATDPAFSPGSLIVDTSSAYGTFEYQGLDGVWRPYPWEGAGPELYGLPFRCNLYNLASPKGRLLFLKVRAEYK